jgi:hypothetical protein
MRTSEIAQRLGVSSSTVRNYLRDPEGLRARARAATRAGSTCRFCNRATGAPRGSRTFDLCPRCAASTRTSWTRARVLGAFWRWYSMFGKPPSSTDWNHTHAKRRGGAALERFRSDRWPTSTVVVRLFGTWAQLAEAARTGLCDGDGRRERR